MNRMKAFLVTGFGGGYFPIAPGTVGSAFVAAAFALIVYLTGAGDARIVNAAMGGILIFSCVVCVLLGDFVEETFGKKDPGQCVIDEWAGQAVTFIGAPMAGDLKSIAIVTAVGFFAFRFFDILKPFPARRMERLPKGWGVLCDDLVAGVYALVVVQLLRFVL